MDAHLPSAFRALASLKAPVSHYKVCSTLDSSPEIGSIGRALDIGVTVFGEKPGAWRPLVVAAPAIGRYQAFGNLFARHGELTYRLDQHPVMKNHPVTPMHEADVRAHLARQSERAIGLIDFVAMKDGSGEAKFAVERRAGRSTIALDVVDDETLRWVGALIWENRGDRLFAIGSQGVEYALIAYWRAAGLLSEAEAVAPARREERIVAVSGSVSVVTAAQIARAETQGFESVPLDPAASLDEGAWRTALEVAMESARGALSRGRSPLVITARGPTDPVVAHFQSKRSSVRRDAQMVNERIGAGLGEIVWRLVTQDGVRRAAVSGGDTSGFAMRRLGVHALEAVAPIAPGAPLCRGYAEDAKIDGVEVALKGGQMGAADFFETVRAGGVGV
jgi:3-oxoisoapionate kinase